jgi:nucleoside-diphosphate-sugar epimerase
MDVLITGGNGFVGHHLIQALMDRGDRVRVLALPEENVEWLEERGIRTHRGDICQPATLGAAMEGAEAVVHLAAMMHVWRPLSDYRRVNVTGTENVCNAALMAGVARFVHMSSSSVYGMASSGPVDESFPLSPFPDAYPVTKAEADRVLQRKIADERLPGVIIRPDQIFGPGDRLHFGAAADRIRAGKGIIVGRGDNRIPLVYVTDVVEALMLAVHHGRAVGQAFNVTNDMPMTQEEFMRAIALAIGARSPRRHVPYRPLYAAASAVERVALLTQTEHRPPVTRLGVAFIATDIRFSIDKARRELGYIPRVGLHEGVRIAASWYLRHDPGPSTQPAGRLAERVAQGG